MFKTLLLCAALSLPCLAQQPQMPDVESQRAAMKKLSFLVGKWAGDARIFPSSGAPIEMAQTEEAEYKLDGLVLMIEGVGRNKADGKPTLQALGIISYDDETATYHMRAYNNGRFLETEVKLADNGHGMSWGFVLGEIKFSSVLRIDDKGDWSESHDITVGSEPRRKFMEVRVSPQK